MLRSIHRKLSIHHKLEASLSTYLNDPVKFVVIPLNRNNNFLYFKHSDELANKSSRLIRLENWGIRKTTQLWDKINNSPRKLNKKIVSYVRPYLITVPWQELSLLTIPGENHILKRVEAMEKELKLTKKQYLDYFPKPAIKPISIYYPQDNNNLDIIHTQLTQFYRDALSYHKKKLLQCLLGIPLTLPLALVPIIPNVPGFYLAYRAYCNFKAYIGARHLEKMFNDNIIEYRSLSQYSVEIPDNKTLTTDQLKNIVKKLQIPDAGPSIETAINQLTNSE